MTQTPLLGLRDRWTRLGPAFQCRSTYDASHPWVLYRYRIPDALAYLIGFSRIWMHCLICGRAESVWLRVWKADPKTGQAIRLSWLELHGHASLRWLPLYWHKPMGNFSAWVTWRDDQIRRN